MDVIQVAFISQFELDVNPGFTSVLLLLFKILKNGPKDCRLEKESDPNSRHETSRADDSALNASAG